MKKITLATVKSVLRKGGATFNKNGERVNMRSGYQVSKHDLYTIPTEKLSSVMLREALQLLSGRGEYLGVWVDNGQAYVDISRRVSTKKEAMKMGRDYNQLSVLRWKDCACLSVE